MSLHQKLYTGALAQSADLSKMKVRKYTPNNKQLNFGPGTAPASHTTPLQCQVCYLIVFEILIKRLSMVRTYGRGYVLSWALFAMSMAALIEMAATKSDKKAFFSAPLLHEIKVNRGISVV